jgi:hypothetical protein
MLQLRVNQRAVREGSSKGIYEQGVGSMLIFPGNNKICQRNHFCHTP